MDNNAGAGGGDHGIKFEFVKRELKGEYSPSEKATKEMMDKINAEQDPNNKYWTHENYKQKREEANQMIGGMGQIFGATMEEHKALCDQTSFEVTAKDGTTLKVYMCKPKTLAGPNAPAFVWARGGGAIMFEAEDFTDFVCIDAVKMNCVYFNVGFRNGPEVKCPTGQQDFVDCFLHIHTNAATWGVDPTKIAIGGVSGGGWISVGAANLMVKSGDIGKVNSMFINTGMLSHQTGKVPKEQLGDHEKDPLMMEATYKLHATDWENQQNDDQLFPGLASDDILKKYPPVVVQCQEFDFLRRDNEVWAARLKALGRLVDISIMPGCTHGLMGSGPETQEYAWYFEEVASSYNAVCVQPKN